MTRTHSRAAAASLILLGIASAALGLGARSQGEVESTPAAFEAAHGAARTALVGRLLTLAQWCHESELFEERDRLWNLVIGIDVDNAEARKGLRYARNTDGSWKEPAPRPAKNRNPSALEKLPAKRAEAVQPFRDELVGRFESEKIPLSARKTVLDEILAVDPDDESCHTLLGEARVDGKWVLAETATGKARRAAIRAAADSAKAVPAAFEKTEASDEDKALFEKWKCGTQLGTIRVLASGDDSQCQKLADACRIAAQVFQVALGREPAYAEGFTLYVVAGKGEKETFISKIPDLDDPARAAMKKTIGGGLPGTWKVAIFEPEPARLLDCAVRHALAHLLNQGFHVGTAQPWIFEGFGLYLTREVCGTRLTWFCSGTGVAGEGKNSPRAKLMVASSNWMNEALQVLSKEPAPDLGKVLAKDMAAMGVDDLLVSYALAAYLIEGRPDSVASLLQSAGEGKPAAEAVQATLGLTVPELQTRLVQWLKERK